MVFKRTGTRTGPEISRIALDWDRTTQDWSWVVRSRSTDWSGPVHQHNQSTDWSRPVHQHNQSADWSRPKAGLVKIEDKGCQGIHLGSCEGQGDQRRVKEHTVSLVDILQW